MLGNASNYGLILNQTLWSFEAFHRLRESGAQVGAAEATYRSAEQNLILRVAQAYFAILSAADQLTTNPAEREAFGGLLHQAQVREQTGIGPRSDVEQSQAFYDLAEQPVIDAENALDDARRALEEITRHQPDGVAPLREDIPLAVPIPADPDAWISIARQDNFEVAAAALNAEAARRDIAVQRAKYLPVLAAQAGATRLRQNEDFGGDQDIDSVGVSVSWPFSRAARFNLWYARPTQPASRRRLSTIARSGTPSATYLGVATGVERIRAAQRAADSSRAAIEANKRNVAFGTSSEFELLNALNDYHAAVRAYLQTRYEHLTAELQLKQQVGGLDQRGLCLFQFLRGIFQ